MENIRFAEKLIELRKQKKITQEQLAEFCGVTKASVSKWETRQTLPDILLLPRIASFFDVTIDELLGYEAHLSREQIEKIFDELLAEFGTKEFGVVMDHCMYFVKQYYSCHELLEQMILLWLSHEMVAGDRREELLKEAKKLCQHILGNSRNISLCNDVAFLQSIVDLLLGHPEDTIEALEEMNNPCRLSVQGEEVLLSAYIEMGMQEKGNDFAQMMMYLHILMLVSTACRFVVVNKDNLNKCKETQRRIDEIIKIYNVEAINFHYVTLFIEQMAQVYCYHGEKELAIEQLTRYVDVIERYLAGQINYLQSDDYLDRLQVWFDRSVMSNNFPREKGTVCDSMLVTFKSKAYDILRSEKDFMELEDKVKKMKKNL